MAERILRWPGVCDAYVRIRRPRGAVVLMYHSVPSPDLSPWIDPRNAVPHDAFREQMQFLSTRRRVVSMTELVDTLRSGRSPPTGTVVLTFDDGYRDNLTVAAPILAEFGLPATLYLPTGYVARGENQWVDRLYGMFRTRSRDRLEVTSGASLVAGRLDDGRCARSAYGSVCAMLLAGDHGDRARILGEVEGQLRPSATAPRMTLTWDEVRATRREFPTIDLGGHTVDHLDIHAQSERVCRREVLGCAEDIERETESRPAHFSYPYGRGSPAAQREVAACGFSSAVAAGDDVLVRAGTDVFAIPRIEAPVAMSQFRLRTSGAFPRIARLAGNA